MQVSGGDWVKASGMIGDMQDRVGKVQHGVGDARAVVAFLHDPYPQVVYLECLEVITEDEAAGCRLGQI